MASEGSSQIEELYSKVDSFLKNGQYKKALKRVEEILKLEKDDEDALKCKVYILIQSSQFEEAIKTMQGKLGNQMSYEKAYCLYRFGKFPEALQALQKVKDDRKHARLELEGQLHYKMGNHSEAIRAYKELIGNLGADTMEVKANFVAAMVAGGQSSEMENDCKALGITANDGFEVAFNQACGLVENKQYQAAKEQLELALREGQEALYSEDLAEEEVDLELLPVSVQLAYVNSALGQHDEATEGYKAGLQMKGVDELTKMVIENNMLAQSSRLMPDQPQKKVVNEGLKKLDKMLTGPGASKLTPVQRSIVTCNRALLLLMVGSFHEASDVLRLLQKEFPQSDRVKLVKATVLAKEKKFSEAEKVVQDLIDSASDGTLSPLLMRAQLLAANNTLHEAVEILSGIQDPKIKNKGAMVATQAALFERVGNSADCEKLVSSVLEWWQGEGASEPGSANAVAWCLDQLAGLKLRLGEADQAMELYRKALDSQLDEVERAQLVSKLSRVLAVVDTLKTEELEGSLKVVPEASNADVNILEGSIKGTRRKDDDSRKRQIETHGGEKPKKRRKRKPRYPKGFDPESPGPKPDPERWMPKWQRAGYKKRNKRRKDQDMKGSQGAGKVDESLDRTKQSGEASGSSRSRPAKQGGRKRGGRR